MAAVEGAVVDTSALTRARHPAVAQELKALRNDGKLWTCDIVTLELGYSARSLVEWQAVQTVQRLLPTAAISASVTRRAQEVQGRLAATRHHRLPLPGRFRGQPLHAADEIRPHLDELARLGIAWHINVTAVIGRDSEFSMEFA